MIEEPKCHLPNDGQSLRLDKILWFLRFARNRTMAKKLATKGYVRLNGRRADKAHCPIRCDDILTIPMGRDVVVIRISQLPKRRGAASNAMTCYEVLTTGK